MEDLLAAIISKIYAFVAWIGKLFVALFVSFWDFFRDILVWPFEQILDIVVSAISSLDFGTLSDGASSWGSLPGEVINILGLLGVAPAAAIITTAITVRLVLQLIPFVRLGS